MATHELGVNLVKSADRVADLSFWISLVMVATALAALAFKVSLESVQSMFLRSLWLIGGSKFLRSSYCVER